MPLKLFVGYSDRHGDNWSEVVSLTATTIPEAIEEARKIICEQAPPDSTEHSCHHASIADVVGDAQRFEPYP